MEPRATSQLVRRWACAVVRACCCSESPPSNRPASQLESAPLSLTMREWGRLLPPDWETDLRFAVGGPIAYSSKKEYERLCAGVLLDAGEQAYWLDAATGSVCRAVSARALHISWGDDTRYWTWEPGSRCQAGSSRFEEVAFLKMVCWLEISGQVYVRLPPGIYTLSARIAFAKNWLGWDVHLVNLSLTTLDGQVVTSRGYLRPPAGGGQAHQVIKLRKAEDNWLECDIGQFTVSAEQLGMDLDVKVYETGSDHWKAGLFLDGVVIRPSFLINACTIRRRLGGA